MRKSEQPADYDETRQTSLALGIDDKSSPKNTFNACGSRSDE